MGAPDHLSCPPRVTILMAMRNGLPFLMEQLESFKSQSLPPSQVIVGDDGSTDGSGETLRAFFDNWPTCALTIVAGPQNGYAANFASLFKYVPENSDYVALSDQDDVWLNDKIERGVRALERHCDQGRQGLYGSTSWVCDRNLKKIETGRLVDVVPGFEHALVQNYAGGNTMMLNRAATRNMKQAFATALSVPVHDWFIYQFISGAGGVVLFDTEPSLLYRQHHNNQIGANTGFLARLKRFRAMLNGTYMEWNDANLSALEACGQWLEEANHSKLLAIIDARSAGLLVRFSLIWRHGLRRQGFTGQAGLWISLLLNRF